MAAFKPMAFLALLVVLLPTTALGDLDDLAPALSPFFDKMCEKVNCGKGKCRADMTRPFNFRCECEPGWKKTKDNDEDNDHSFLPCIIPDCTLHYDSCHTAPPPDPDKVPHNISVFERTLGADCEKLGIRSSDSQKTSSNNETISRDDENQAISFQPGKFHWMSILIMSMVIAIWK
ncbi:Neurogenic locus notch-like protein [Citrus sinensis]|nr:Neurogenic locus notch-like protein [Citrus sinensis]